MKTIVVEIPDNISVKAAMRAIKDIIFVSLGSICTVRELPGAGEVLIEQLKEKIHSLRMLCFDYNSDKMVLSRRVDELEKLAQVFIKCGDPKPWKINEWKTAKLSFVDTVHVPGAGEGEKSCKNCGGNRGSNGMPCLRCGGAVTPCDFSNWQPIPSGNTEIKWMCPKCGFYNPNIRSICAKCENPNPGKVDPASGPMPSKTAALLAGLEDDKLDKVDDKNLCVCHYQSNPECQICNNPQYKNEYCLNCGHHKSCHSKG
jgi:hypothetical protein